MLTDLDKLAVEFFKLFARTEGAMKATAEYRTVKQNGNVEANWDRFATALQPLLDSPTDPALAEAVDYLLAQPPKSQRVVNGQLEWRDVPASQGRRSADLLYYVRRVRNNLFHGGKFNQDWFMPERSATLIRHGMTVLRHSVRAVPAVYQAYQATEGGVD